LPLGIATKTIQALADRQGSAVAALRRNVETLEVFNAQWDVFGEG